MSIGCKKAPPAPGSEIKSTHCSGDSIQFSLKGEKVTVAITEIKFKICAGVYGGPQLDMGSSLFGKQYTVYCYDWEQKMHYFPCLPY